jgi:hypothetical protein
MMLLKRATIRVLTFVIALKMVCSHKISQRKHLWMTANEFPHRTVAFEHDDDYLGMQRP